MVHFGFRNFYFRSRFLSRILGVAVSRSSFAMSNSLIMDYVLNCSGISIRCVGIPISVGIIASIT